MQFKYTINQNNLKKTYLKNYRKINIIYIFAATILFFLITKNVAHYNYLAFFIFYLILLVLLITILKFFNKFYVDMIIKSNEKKDNIYGDFVFTLNKEVFIIENIDSKLTVKWKDVRKIRFNKDKIYIKDKNNSLFVINKDFLQNVNDFEKIVKSLKKKAYAIKNIYKK